MTGVQTCALPIFTDWLAAEDALDKDHAGQVDEALEDAFVKLIGSEEGLFA